jgi:hypothetical protein
MEPWEDAFSHGAKVYEHVAATDQIQIRERRIVDEIMPAEYTQLPESFADLVPPFDFCKVSFEALKADVRDDVLHVFAAPGLLYGAFADIGRENLYGEGSACLREIFV